jgi:hypothetical protein
MLAITGILPGRIIQKGPVTRLNRRLRGEGSVEENNELGKAIQSS